MLARTHAPGQFLLTACAALAPQAGLRQFELRPLAQAELLGATTSVVDRLLDGEPPRVRGAAGGRAATAELVLSGGFPDACARTPRARAEYFRAYVGEVLARDLPQIAHVRSDPARLAQLLHLLAARTSAAVNHAALARRLAVDEKTAKAHVELLVRLGLLVALPAWAGRIGGRPLGAARILLCDSGLAASLAAVDPAGYAGPHGAQVARMLIETFAVTELAKQASWSEAEVALSYYRDTEKRAVDLVIESREGDVIALAASSAVGADAIDTRGLRLLRDRLGRRLRAAIAVYPGADTVALGERLWALPVCGLIA